MTTRTRMYLSRLGRKTGLKVSRFPKMVCSIIRAGLSSPRESTTMHRRVWRRSPRWGVLQGFRGLIGKHLRLPKADREDCKGETRSSISTRTMINWAQTLTTYNASMWRFILWVSSSVLQHTLSFLLQQLNRQRTNKVQASLREQCLSGSLICRSNSRKRLLKTILRH